MLWGVIMYHIEPKNGIVRKGNNSISYAELIKEIQPNEDDVVYLGGSLIEGSIEKLSSGMGNEKSDLDVFIIRNNDVFQKTNGVYEQSVRKTFFIDSLFDGIDVEIYDRKFVDDLVEVLAETKLDANKRSQNLFYESKLESASYRIINTFLNRLKYSICIYNKTAYDSIRNKLDFRRFLELKKTNQLTRIDNMFPDIEGNAKAGHFHVALYCLRELFMEVAEYVLSQEGIYVDRKKWVILKLSNLVAQEGCYNKLWSSYQRMFLDSISFDDRFEKEINYTIDVLKETIEDSLFAGGTL